jgi:predicted acylesterase/phospholipase RssA
MASSRHTSIGLVLSGGGTRLFAHIGFLWALDDAGLLAPGQPVAAAVGNSAGSLVGAMLALGYAPREMWELAYWRIWGYPPPAEPRAWRGDPRPRGLGVAVDLDFDGLAHAVTRNLSYFKGIDTGRRFEALLQRILEREGPDGRPNPEFHGTRPPEALLPLYLIGLNLANRRETIFEFTGHCPGAPQPPLGSYPAALGREASYEVCRDQGDPRASPKELFRPWEGVRISTSLPLTFRPYYKPRFVATHWDAHGQPFRIVQGAYFSDGGSRDNYPLNVAIKLAGCDAIMGCFLGALEYPFELVGTGTAVDLVTRNVDGMMHALFEADQDDAEIIARPVRTVVPHIPQRPGVTFDLSQIGAVMEAGYIAAAYYLRRLRPEMADADFMAAMVEGRMRVSWAEVLAPGTETWGQPAGGRAPLRTGARAAPRPASDYYIVQPTQEFEEAAIRFFAERYPAVAAMAAPGSPLEQEIARRNRERREVALEELDEVPFRDAALAQAQRAAVAWVEGLSWAAASGLIAGLATALLAAWAVLGHLLRLVPAPDPVDMWTAELLILVIAPGLGWVLRRLAVWLVWEQVKAEIRKSVGFQ